MTAIEPERTESDNRTLYQEGEDYLKELPGLLQGGKYPEAILKPIAVKYATSVAEVRTAVEFVAAVNQIAQVAGAPAKELILSGQNVLVTPVLVGKLCKQSPARLKVALQNAAEGLHPRAPHMPKDTPLEQLRWDYHLSRLREINNLRT